MRAILDIETNSAEEFGAVMQELKEILPNRKAVLSLISAANHFEEDHTLNVLTDGEIEIFNKGICRA
jgi:hypothetical protein